MCPETNQDVALGASTGPAWAQHGNGVWYGCCKKLNRPETSIRMAPLLFGTAAGLPAVATGYWLE